MLNGLLPGSTWQEITRPDDIGDALASIVNGYGQLIGRPTSCSPHRKIAYAFCNIEAVLAGESMIVFGGQDSTGPLGLYTYMHRP